MRGAMLVVALGAVALAGCQSRLPRFAATLAHNDSATVALGQWCAARHFATPAVIRAELQHDTAPSPPDLAGWLGLVPGEALGFRHVALRCGTVKMSDARNWYRPGQLTPAMNAALVSSERPFGLVVAALGFHRQRLATQRGALPGCPSGTVWSEMAVLRKADGTPFSLVLECYPPHVLR